MHFVDGYVLAVHQDKKADYLALAQVAADAFKQNGALQVVECWGVEVPDGDLTSFPMAVKCEPGEVVVFSWISWPSKAVRDEGMAKAMNDERFKAFEGRMPFDGKRMIFGGFEQILAE